MDGLGTSPDIAEERKLKKKESREGGVLRTDGSH